MASTNPGYIQRVQTDDGWHARIRGNNNEDVWITPGNLNDRATVDNAVEVLGALFGLVAGAYPALRVEDVDERTNRGDG